MRVYLRKPPNPWAPIWLIVGTRQISACNEFAKWFRRTFGEEAALQDVWEAMTCPVLTNLMATCSHQICDEDPSYLLGCQVDVALARKIRLVMPGELLEALLTEEP